MTTIKLAYFSFAEHEHATYQKYSALDLKHFIIENVRTSINMKTFCESRSSNG